MQPSSIDYKALCQGLIFNIAETIDPKLKQKPAQIVLLDSDFYINTQPFYFWKSYDDGPKLETITTIKQLKNLILDFRSYMYTTMEDQIKMAEDKARGWDIRDIPEIPCTGEIDFTEPFSLYDLALYDGKYIDLENKDYQELINNYEKGVDPEKVLQPDRLIVLSALVDTAELWAGDWFIKKTDKDIFERLIKIRSSLDQLGEENSKKC